MRQRFVVNNLRHRSRHETRAECCRGVTRQRKRRIGQAQAVRRVERGGLDGAPFALCVIPCVIGPVHLVHARVDCRQHTFDRRIAQTRALGAGEQRADRHHRAIQAESESLRDAGRRPQTRERSRPRTEGNRVAISELETGFVEQFADRGQQARAGHRAGRLMAHPRARFGGKSTRRVDGGGQQRDRAEFGRRIEGKQHSSGHDRYCNARPPVAGQPACTLHRATAHIVRKAPRSTRRLE